MVVVISLTVVDKNTRTDTALTSISAQSTTRWVLATVLALVIAMINDNSGVLVRFAAPGNDPWVAVNTGYEIQIDDLGMPDGNPLYKTGAIYKFAAPIKLASKSVGEWNTFEIEIIDQKYSVILNSEKVVSEFTGNRLTEGFIGIQNHDADSKVSFKNIKIKELQLA